MKKLVFSVTNDLNYDQRMHRICKSLQCAGYDVLLVGRKLRTSIDLIPKSYRQKRLNCLFSKGKLFYLEYNLRLFFFLLFERFDLVCAIDLDTVVPVFLATELKGKERVYDAHEQFCEMKEIVSRPGIKKVWLAVEKLIVPQFKIGYTVNNPIRDYFKEAYNVNYEVIMNAPVLTDVKKVDQENFIIYQGAVNHGRSFETLIPAFRWINCCLWIYGTGNFYREAVELTRKFELEDKVIFKGNILPDELRSITPKAKLGITLFENNGLSNYYSLANRFFDYIHAGIPQICVDYPVYNEINREFEVAVLVTDLSSESLADVINLTLENDVLRGRLQRNCLAARSAYNWQEEEKKLVRFYNKIFSIE